MYTPVRTILKSLQIGQFELESPLTLAPMAGHTNYAFRRLIREISDDCGLVCTEVISSNVLNNDGSRARGIRTFDWREDEFPFAVQLFGAEAWKVAEAAKIVVEHGAKLIDINMGCWVPKVAKKGGGAALLRDVSVATEVVAAVVNAVDVPVTVKVRTGFEDGKPTAIEFARHAQSVGAQAIAVHARYARQGHAGSADWEIIRKVKETVPDLPVIGNGDIHTGADAERMFRETGCDGVMIGRAALGQPWIFQHVRHYLETGEDLPEPPRWQRAQYALRLAHLTLETTWMRQESAIRELRGQLSKYKLDRPGSVAVRNRIVRVESLAEIEAILQPIIDDKD